MKRVSHKCVNVPLCAVRPVKYSPCMKELSVVGFPKAMRFPLLSVPIPMKSLHRAIFPLKWKMLEGSLLNPAGWLWLPFLSSHGMG